MRFEGQEKERKLNSSNLKREQLNCDCDFQEKEYDHILNPQYTEERMGKAERTEMDPHIVMLEKKTENTKNYTERIKNNATAVILPNPGDRHRHLLHHPHHLYNPHRRSHDDWLFDNQETLSIPLILTKASSSMYHLHQQCIIYTNKSIQHHDFQCLTFFNVFQPNEQRLFSLTTFQSTKLASR